MVTQSAVSARRVLANRANAAQSTGPRTAEGKDRASRNRLCHGFFSRHLLLPGEDPAELEELRQELREDLRPHGRVEELLVERLLAAHWKLARLQQAEKEEPSPSQMLSKMIYCGTESDRISIYQNRLEGTIHRCMRELRLLRKKRAAREGSPPLPSGEGNRPPQKMRFEPNAQAGGLPEEPEKHYNSPLCPTG